MQSIVENTINAVSDSTDLQTDNILKCSKLKSALLQLMPIFLVIVSLVFSMGLLAALDAEELPTLPYEFSVKWDISKKENSLVQDFVVERREPVSPYSLIFSPIDQFKTKTLFYFISIHFVTKHIPQLSVSRHSPYFNELLEMDRKEKEGREFVGGSSYYCFVDDPVNPYIISAEEMDFKRKKNHDYLKGRYTIKYDKPGKMIPISLKLQKIEGNELKTIIPEQTLNTTGSADGSFTRLIKGVDLTPGKYRITLNTLENITLPYDLESYLKIYYPVTK